MLAEKELINLKIGRLHNFYKKFFLLFILILIFNQSNAQSIHQPSVIYLKNQSIFRGTIVYKDTALLKLQTLDGNILAIKILNIDSIQHVQKWNMYQPEKGFVHYTELGPLIAGKTTINGVTTAAFSLQTIQGYRFKQWLISGIGTGADLYATQTIIPVFISLRGDLQKTGTAIPFYFIDGGYGINITQSSAAGENYKGGIMYAFGLGLKIPFNQKAGFLLSAGYRYQSTNYQINGNNETVYYQRLAIRAGFFL